MKSLLSVEQLHVKTKSSVATSFLVKAVSFAIGHGEVLGLMGASGSGKSMIAKSILKLHSNDIEVSSGQIFWEGKDLMALSENELRGVRGREISMVFQDPMSSLNPYLTIGSQLRECFCIHSVGRNVESETRILETLSEVQLPSPKALLSRYPHELSGGMRQRVMIAMALLLGPKLLIADEPTTALDVTTQSQILSLLHRLRKSRGLSLLLVTHDFGVLAGLADRVVVLFEGEVVEEGPVEEILSAPKHSYTRALVECRR